MNGADEILGPALARGQADDPAILFEDETISYGVLSSRVCQAGHALRAAGISRGERVLMVVHDHPKFFYAYLGAMKIGAVPCALSLRGTAADLLFAINDSACGMLILDREFVPLFQEIAGQIAHAPLVVVADDTVDGFPSLSAMMDRQPDTLESVSLGPEDPVLWMYTSGTTGTPKGAVHAIRAIEASERFLKLIDVGPGDRIFCSSKLFFAFSLGHVLLGSMRLGATSILFRGWPSAEAFADVVAQYHPTAVFSVPTLYSILLREGLATRAAFKDVSTYVAAGERLPESVFDQWRAATGRPIIEGIGATEVLMMFLSNRSNEQRPGSCGIPIPGCKIKLTDENDQPVTEPGVPGVGWVRTCSVAQGYWRQEDKTRAAFHDGWYRTGDVFSRDADGWFYHLGRSDDMLRISGQWVSPLEIEEVVRRNPKVVDVAVVAAPNAQGLTRLRMYLVSSVPPAERPGIEAALMDQMRAELSIYKCPRQMIFVDELPRTPTGKVQRFRLRDRDGDGA